MSERPLIIAVTGHVGAGRSTVAGILRDEHGMDYVSMSSFLSQSGTESVGELQDRGDELRRGRGEDAVAQQAIGYMREKGECAYVVDGIKNPAEAQALAAYGRLFLWAVQASTETRWQRTRHRFMNDQTSFNKADARDDRETDQWNVLVPYGQRVADCLSLADAMIWNDGLFLGSSAEGEECTLAHLERKCEHLYQLIRSPGCMPPTLTEVRMSQAYAIAHRSSCLQRKVGAVIVNDEGRILAEGYNEVPRGQHSCNELYRGCYRERLRDEELAELARIFVCRECGGDLSPCLECRSCGGRYAHLLPRRKNLDYCRALHAEENAILQTSKHGGMGLQGTSILVTAFPCALCAKKIVTCDIARVIFTEPYDVQEAKEFFRQAGTTVQAFEGFTQNGFHRAFM